VEQVWRPDLVTLCWEAMPALTEARSYHACCAVRNGLVVSGGIPPEGAVIGSVEMLAKGEGVFGVFTGQLSLTCGGIAGAVAIVLDEIDSAAGQVLLLKGHGADIESVSTVYLVDVATGECTPQPNILRERCEFTAMRLPDGRVVCAGVPVSKNCYKNRYCRP